MSPTFTDDDVGKPVVSATGETVGTVVGVDAATAQVDPDPRMANSLSAVLEWERDPGDPVPITADAVDRITDDAIRLEGMNPEGGEGAGDEPGGEDSDSAGRRGRAEEAESTDEETNAVDVDADLDEVTDGDPEVDIQPGEDVGDRTDTRETE